MEELQPAPGAAVGAGWSLTEDPRELQQRRAGVRIMWLGVLAMAALVACSVVADRVVANGTDPRDVHSLDDLSVVVLIAVGLVLGLFPFVTAVLHTIGVALSRRMDSFSGAFVVSAYVAGCAIVTVGLRIVAINDSERRVTGAASTGATGVLLLGVVLGTVPLVVWLRTRQAQQ